MLGLNPLEQEILDLTNEIARNGFIYFPEFCQIVTKKYREEDGELFRQNMFKVNSVTSNLKLHCSKIIF
jgi:Ca2+-binding EF-hand superfamily protein